MKPSDTTVVNKEQVKELYPEIGETATQLMVDYINLTRAAVQLELFEPLAVTNLEERYRTVENIFERLHYQSADILSLLKDLVNSIHVPEDPKAFEEWVKYSDEYPKVICHDAFFDVFIASKKALTGGN